LMSLLRCVGAAAATLGPPRSPPLHTSMDHESQLTPHPGGDLSLHKQ